MPAEVDVSTMQLESLLSPSSILPDLTVNSTRQLLQSLAKVAARETGIKERTLFQALAAREQQGSTGFGHGVAVPHARFPDLDRAVGVFARLKPPVGFDAPDQRPVDLVFCLLSPDGNQAQHLAILATITRRLGRPALRRVLRGASDADAIHALLTGQEIVQDEAA